MVLKIAVLKEVLEVHMGIVLDVCLIVDLVMSMYVMNVSMVITCLLFLMIIALSAEIIVELALIINFAIAALQDFI